MAEPQPDSSIKAWFHHHEAQIKRGLISGLGLIAVGLWFCGDLQNPTPVSADASKHCTNCLIYDPAPLPESKKLSPHSQEQIQQIIATGLPLSAEVQVCQVKDQGSSAACGSYATSCALEAEVRINERPWWGDNSQPAYQIDPHSIHDNLVGDCSTGTTFQAIGDFLSQTGPLRSIDSPVSPDCRPTLTDMLRQKAAQFQADFRYLFRDLGTAAIEQIQAMIFSHKPVVVGMFIGNQFSNATCDTIIDEKVTPGIGGHAVVLDSYSTDENGNVIIGGQNSWGEAYGCKGKFKITAKSLRENAFEGLVIDDKLNPPSEVLATHTRLSSTTIEASSTTSVESANNTLTINLSETTATSVSKGCTLNHDRNVATCSLGSLSPGETIHTTVTLSKKDTVPQTFSTTTSLCGQPDLTEEDHPPCSIPETANFIDRVKKLFLSLISKDFSVR